MSQRKKTEAQIAALQQRQARLADRLARLRQRSRAAETAELVALGAVVRAAARTTAESAAWVADAIRQHASRPADRRRLAELLAELELSRKSEKPPV